MSGLLWLIVPGLFMWLGNLLAPWFAWSTRQRLEPKPGDAQADLTSVTVLIPARDESDVIAGTLGGLVSQGRGLRVIVIDDQSTDGTAEIARSFAGVEVVQGQPLADGWAGKLWALEQGLGRVQTPLTLLLDADIALEKGMLPALLALKRQRGVALASLMAWLKMDTFWDRLLLPAFVYYFKLLYPFSLANGPSKRFAAAAGGCVLIDTAVLKEVGAFDCLRDALIDDCTLAARVKSAGHRTWVGLSRGVLSLRPYGSLRSIHSMVARSAFTQLRYSVLLLLLLTVIFVAAYGLPLVALAFPGTRWLAIVALGAMMVAYIPTLLYYRRSPLWSLLSPLIGALFLGMTWSSALSYWRGVRSSWKGRDYSR